MVVSKSMYIFLLFREYKLDATLADEEASLRLFAIITSRDLYSPRPLHSRDDTPNPGSTTPQSNPQPPIQLC